MVERYKLGDPVYTIVDNRIQMVHLVELQITLKADNTMEKVYKTKEKFLDKSTPINIPIPVKIMESEMFDSIESCLSFLSKNVKVH